METSSSSLKKNKILKFKIDLIVWKHEFLADRIEFINEFKIDLIVWKQKINWIEVTEKQV